MVINWYGEGCFKIQTSDTAILIDPLEADSGLTPPRFKADIVLRTTINLPTEKESTEKDETTTLDAIGPGSYEAKNIEIAGYPLAAGKTVYILKAEDMRLGFLGTMDNSNLTPDIDENIAEADILFIPAGGSPYIDQEVAAKLVKQINPRLVVTSFFKIPGLKKKSGDIKDFLEEMDQKIESQEKLTIKKKDLPAKTQVVVLKRV